MEEIDSLRMENIDNLRMENIDSLSLANALYGGNSWLNFFEYHYVSLWILGLFFAFAIGSIGAKSGGAE